MPMPELDPSRFFVAVLADPTHKLPLPGRAHLFSAVGEMIDSELPLYAHLLADGSLKRKPDDVTENAPAADASTPAKSKDAASTADTKSDAPSDQPKASTPAKASVAS